MASNKITLLAERLYIIRSARTKPSGEVLTRYYETPSTWNMSPMEATIFQNYEAGEGHLAMYRKRDAAPKGWADGSTEVLDVVPLYGEILQSPNGSTISAGHSPSKGL